MSSRYKPSGTNIQLRSKVFKQRCEMDVTVNCLRKEGAIGAGVIDRCTSLCG